jgi:hypothetical protein
VQVELPGQAAQIFIDGFPRTLPVAIVINDQYTTFAKEWE